MSWQHWLAVGLISGSTKLSIAGDRNPDPAEDGAE